MNDYVTIVIRKPQDEAARAKIAAALEMLRPFQTAMSLEDEMTVLEMIEQHPAFDEAIADDAREQTKARHAKAAVAA